MFLFKSHKCLIVKALALISLLLLISCNGDDNSGVIMKKVSATRLDSLNYGLVRFQTQWLHQAQFAGFYVAHQKGFYQNYGIDVRINMGGPDNPSPQALANNKAEFTTMFLTSALREIDNGADIVNIAQLSQKSSLLLVAKKSSGIHNIQDLNGKKIGLWVNDFREPSIALLKKYSIQAEIVPISWTTNVLAHDVVDAMNMMVYNEYDVFLNTGYSPAELSVFPLSNYGVNIPEDGIYCNKDYYKKNPELCKDFAEATLDGWLYALNHEEETLSIVLQYLKQEHLPANIPHQRWMLKRIKEAVLANPTQFGKLSEKSYNDAVKMLKDNKIINANVEYQDFIGYADKK
jgi:NitT/TauT family transport system substrate-binding protein